MAYCTNNDNEDQINYNKTLNSRCYCKIGLQWKCGNTVMILPCEHMFHEKCIDKIINSNKRTCEPLCPLCKLNRTMTIIEKKISLHDPSIHYQRFSDILSMTYYDDMSGSTPGRFIDSMFDLASLIAKLPFVSDKMDGRKWCEQLFTMNNMTLKVYGMEKLKLEKKKVYICNHVAHLELIILYYLFGTGFLASNIVDESPFASRIKEIVPLLTFNRGDKNRKVNLVESMKQFVDENGSICLFPEGLMKHPDTLVRFRTGAFHIGHPIYAITIRHNDLIADGLVEGFIYKYSGKKNINIDVHIQGPYYAPFDEAKIEKIRYDMARVGNMVLSRVSNRDIVD